MESTSAVQTAPNGIVREISQKLTLFVEYLMNKLINICFLIVWGKPSILRHRKRCYGHN